MKILFFLKAVVLAELIPQEVRVHVTVALGIHSFTQFVRDIEKVRAVLHALETIENGEAVNPLCKFRETRIAKVVFAPGLEVFQVAVGNAVTVFDKNIHGVREKLFAGQVFVHNDAETEVVYRGRQVFAHDGLFRGAVAGRHLSAVFGDGFAHFCLGVTEVAYKNLVVVLVLRVLAKEQILGL